jgi:hypothetical protein
MDQRDPNIEDEIKQTKLFIALLTTVFFMVIVLVVLLISLSSCAHNNGKCPAYYSKEIKANKSNV